MGGQVWIDDRRKRRRVGWIEFTVKHFHALVVSLRESFSSSFQNNCAHSEWLNSTATRLSEHFTVHTVGEKVLRVLNITCSSITKKLFSLILSVTLEEFCVFWSKYRGGSANEDAFVHFKSRRHQCIKSVFNCKLDQSYRLISPFIFLDIFLLSHSYEFSTGWLMYNCGSTMF